MYDSKHRTTDTQFYESRKDASGYSSNKRDWNSQGHGNNDESSNHRKYIRTQSSSNNRVSSNCSASSSSSQQQQQQRENGEKKTSKDTKKPLRVHGDWSEYKSSTGKTYFYNCKTEVSQWEKPKGWPTDEPNRTNNTSSNSSTERIKKESISQVSSTIRTRHKMEETSSDRKPSQTSNIKVKSENSNYHHDANHSHQSPHEQLPIIPRDRVPTSDDDSSGMSFSSTSSKESPSLVQTTNITNSNNSTGLHPSVSDSVSTFVSDTQLKLSDNTTKIINGTEDKSSISKSMNSTLANAELATVSDNESTISKVERDQDIQKFYRADLVEHLTGWQSNILEKQCLKIFDDYYAYSAKISTAFTELKALKANYRRLDIKRNILTCRHIRCQEHMKKLEENKNF